LKTPCPDKETVAAYLEGFLPPTEKHRTEAHLSACDACLEEVFIGRLLMKQSEVTAPSGVPSYVTDAAVNQIIRQNENWYRSLWGRLKQLIRRFRARRVDFFRPMPAGALQISTVRGNRKKAFNDLVHIHRAFEKFETDIEIEKTGPSRAHIRIQLSSDSPITRAIRVTLKRGDREIFSSLLKDGHMVFEDVAFGRYTLVFARNGGELGIYPFEIMETGRGR